MEEVKRMEELLEKFNGQHNYNSLFEKFEGEYTSLVEKFKGQHTSLVEKVKELEEQNKRLKDYIAELRSGVVEAHKPPPRVIDCSDNYIEEQDGSSSSSSGTSSADKNLIQLSNWSNVFTNSLVLNNIFGYLKTQQLQECRLICQEWNGIASSILRKTNNGYGQTIHFGFPYSGYIVPDHELVRIGELHSIVKTASEDWFRTVQLDPEECFERREFTSVLKEFGHQLKFVEIRTNGLEIQELHTILVHYCPNLEKLELMIETDFEGEASELNIPPTKTLKLSYLWLNIDTDGSTQNINRISEVLITILKSSPNLKTLEFWGAHISYSATFFKRLQLSSHLMGNLETIFIPNPLPRNPNLQHRDPLEEMSVINFQSKLKRLVSTNIIQNDGPALSRLLKKTAESLEKLTLTCHENYKKSRSLFVPHLYLPNLKLEFSPMNNLQELKYLAHRELPIHSIDLVAKMPNLKHFMLGFEHQSFFGIRQSSLRVDRKELLDSLFSNCHELLVTPHINLKKLYLFGFIKNPTTTFGLINKFFPNLIKLGVAFPKPLETNSDTEDNNHYYMEFFNGVAELKHLNQLYLQWKDSLHDDNMEFKEGFKSLKNVAKLTHLTVHTRCGIDDFKDELFVAIPKLQRLTLIDISMSLVDAKHFQESLSERNILLEVKEDCYDCGTDYYSLEWDSSITNVI